MGVRCACGASCLSPYTSSFANNAKISHACMSRNGVSPNNSDLIRRWLTFSIAPRSVLHPDKDIISPEIEVNKLWIIFNLIACMNNAFVSSTFYCSFRSDVSIEMAASIEMNHTIPERIWFICHAMVYNTNTTHGHMMYVMWVLCWCYTIFFFNPFHLHSEPNLNTFDEKRTHCYISKITFYSVFITRQQWIATVVAIFDADTEYQ